MPSLSPTTKHQTGCGITAPAVTKPLPLWAYRILRVFATTQTMGETSGGFEPFWIWMMDKDGRDSSDPGAEDLPLLNASIRKGIKEETKALFAERGFCDPHETNWWVNQLVLIDAEEKAARARGNKHKQLATLPDSSADEDEAILEARGGESGDEVELSPSQRFVQQLYCNNAGSGEESRRLMDYEKLVEGEEDGDTGGFAGGGWMDFDDAEVDDEGIEDVSSDEELYATAPAKYDVRADSLMEF